MWNWYSQNEYFDEAIARECKMEVEWKIKLRRFDIYFKEEFLHRDRYSDSVEDMQRMLQTIQEELAEVGREYPRLFNKFQPELRKYAHKIEDVMYMELYGVTNIENIESNKSKKRKERRKRRVKESKGE